MAVRKVLREHQLAVVLLVGFVVFDLFLLGLPPFPVYDEIVYVPVAYNMMELKPEPLKPIVLGSPIVVASNFNLTVYYPNQTLGQDFNVEQPPLAKAIMGVFLYVFSPNVVSYFWARVPSVIMSIIAVVSIYGIGLELFKDKRYALLSMMFLNFDTLFWTASRTALLDIYTLAFMMLGILLYLKNHKYSSTVFFAMSILCKLVGVFGLIAVIAYDLILRKDRKKAFMDNIIRASLCVVLVVAGYTVLVQFFGVSHNPITNFFLYLTWARTQNWTLTLIQGTSPVSQPWSWLFNQTPVKYAWVFDPSTGLPLITIVGQMNPALIFMTIPVLAYSGYEMVKFKTGANTLPLVWFLSAWMPYLVLSFLGQEQFIHHFLLGLPAICLAVVYWLKTQSKVFLVSYTVFLIVAWLWAYPYALLWLYLAHSSLYPLPPLNFFFGA